MKKTTRAGQPPAETGEGRGSEPAFGQGEITRLGMHLKELFESKDWSALRDGLDVDSLWLLDAPATVEEALRQAQDLLEEASELEVDLDRILKTETAEDRASGSYTCSLMWVEPDTWRQREIQFDLHLGFASAESRWRLTYIGITQPTPEDIPFPEEDGEDGAETPAEAQWTLAEPVSDEDGQVLVYVPVRLPLDQVRSLLRPDGPKDGQD